MKISYNTSECCCSKINLEIDENKIVKNVEFIGGCAGNLIGIKSLVIGKKADEVASILEGIRCGTKNTSCPDQLSKAIKSIK
ncbi:TIGR03905 family TSCPD domain-containing protein [Paraclostridium sordellii]|uniref:TIGR03905 family TSCPD domain-containing protein n=1 Tax=Paraclostridium sordellii TaxID=1505 RepID=UPI0022E6A031|nr:TIGR03905 family TSCPD domain-containing protein [Paeniclostridium sordellii]